MWCGRFSSWVLTISIIMLVLLVRMLDPLGARSRSRVHLAGTARARAQHRERPTDMIVSRKGAGVYCATDDAEPT